MTSLEIELRELLKRYNMQACEISILLTQEKPILAISFDEIEEK